MSNQFVVLCGGTGAESSVSLKTGNAIYKALKFEHEVELIELKKNELPESILSNKDRIIFPALHGTWGEDGGLQTILENEGLVYVGSDSQSSSLCFDKIRTKEKVSLIGIPVISGFEYSTTIPADYEIDLDGNYIIKPVCQGSSVGLSICPDRDLSAYLKTLPIERWLVEQMIDGVDLTVGILEGQAMGVVAVRPEGGIYDYFHKYTPGLAQYEVPAKIDSEIYKKVQEYAEQAFEVLGCRDFARIDFILSNQNELFFLEANTIPGMTETSLLPKSASCCELSFNELVNRLVSPSIKRLKQLS
jgi:D-alanine-D-alanine ligase